MSLRGPSLRSRRSQTYVNFRGEAEVWIPTASGEAADHAWSLMRPWRRLIEKEGWSLSDNHDGEHSHRHDSRRHGRPRRCAVALSTLRSGTADWQMDWTVSQGNSAKRGPPSDPRRSDHSWSLSRPWAMLFETKVVIPISLGPVRYHLHLGTKPKIHVRYWRCCGSDRILLPRPLALRMTLPTSSK